MCIVYIYIYMYIYIERDIYIYILEREIDIEREMYRCMHIGVMCVILFASVCVQAGSTA